MSNISKEILHIRRKRLESLMQKYKDKLSNSPTEITRIADQARIDEIELQIESINKLLATQLEPFSTKRRSVTHERAKVVRRKGKTTEEAAISRRKEHVSERTPILIKEAEEPKKKLETLFQ